MLKVDSIQSKEWVGLEKGEGVLFRFRYVLFSEVFCTVRYIYYFIFLGVFIFDFLFLFRNLILYSSSKILDFLPQKLRKAFES